MKNTKNKKNTNKKTMKGRGLLSSYTAPKDVVTPLGSASSGQPCQAQLLNKDGTQARQGIVCTDGTVCQTNSGAKIKSSLKPITYWGQKDVTGKNMGTCQDPENVKSLASRAWSTTKDTVQGTANASLRLNELGKMCGFIPSIQKTESGLNFNKNLWRNLKRNMAILSSIPSDQLETLLTTSQSQSDYQNLSIRLQKHGINLNANDFSNTQSTTQANLNEYAGETAPLVKSEPPLPSGWKSALDQSSGKTYYISPGGQTQWNPPPPSGGQKKKNKSKKNKRNKSKKVNRNLSKKNRVK